MVTAETVAVNWAAAVPAATVTLAGTVTLALLSESVTSIPPLAAGPVSVTVQTEFPGAFTLPGLQDTAPSDREPPWLMVMIPPVPAVGMEAPPPEVADRPLRTTGALVLEVPEAIVKAKVATVPFPIVEVLNPTTRHVAVPLP